ncbi:MAG: hypothetical protein WC471_02240 [Candidatus Woesearchaeota archaeon]
MLYIYTLKDLNFRSAEVEALPLMRDIRKNIKFPISKEMLRLEFSKYFGAMEDLNVMQHSLKLIPEVMLQVVSLPKNSNIYEVISLQRAYTGLNEILQPLEKNILYTKEIIEWQDTFLEELATTLNKMPVMKTLEEKKQFDIAINKFCEKILRNNIDFVFNFYDIVNEAQVARLKDMTEAINQGAFFHITLEEHLKHLEIKEIKQRLPAYELDKVDDIARKINVIRKGVEIAYQNNFKIVEMSILLLAYVMGLKAHMKE